jgi:hypothetical protein
VEEIPGDEVFWEDDRLYCKRCGSELKAPDRDIFEEIVDNRSGFLFRDLADEEEVEDEEKSEEEEAVEVLEVVEAGEEKDPP